MAALLTDKKINSLKPGQWATESFSRGAGQLQARGLSNKRVAYYFRYTADNQKQIRIPLGAELPLIEARRKAAVLSRQHQEGYSIDHTAALSRNPVRWATPNTLIRIDTSSHTLGALLTAYVQDLNHRKCSSAKEVHNAFKKHIYKVWPKYWAMPAIHITTDHILQIVRMLAEQQKLRAADKLRCYIRAAYAAAIQARQHIEGLPALIILNISTNPARDIPPIRQSSQTKDRVLSLKELQQYWQHISKMNSVTGALLQFHLLTGGQRIQQLARVSLQDYDQDSQTITLKDPKGRRTQPRLHTIPLLPQAQEAIEHMIKGCHTNTSTISTPSTTYLWSVTQGQYGACYSTANKALKQVIEDIHHKEGKPLLEPFTLGDIRRTVETRLAAVGVSRETRAQLQSHGLSGVQVRHYDRHDYLKEKKEALELLYELLQTKPVIQEHSP